MDLDLFADYFSTSEQQRRLRRAVMIMFFALAFEKLLSGVDMKIENGAAVLYPAITFLDMVCVAIYLSTALLISRKVPYSRLVIPDFFLLGVKLWVIVSETVFLITKTGASALDRFSAVEHVTEAVLFAAFLVCMFTGELSHGKRLPNFANVCMNLLMVCLPVTVLMEAAKVFIANEARINEFIVGFHFVRDVLGEMFLDVPYFMLILMVSLVPDEGRMQLHG